MVFNIYVLLRYCFKKLIYVNIFIYIYKNKSNFLALLNNAKIRNILNQEYLAFMGNGSCYV